MLRVGAYEDGLLEAMEALCEDEPACERHMFVLGVTRLEAPEYLLPRVRVERAGEVALLCRDEPPAL